MAAFFNLAILDSTILVFPLILTHTCQEWLPPFAQKNLLTVASPPFAQKNFTHSFCLSLMMAAILNLAILDSAILHKNNFSHSFWLNLMMAGILNSAMLNSDTAILDSDTLLSSLRFTERHCHSTLTLNQTNSIWIKLFPSHLTWWWQPSWILPSLILPSLIQTFRTKAWLKLFQSDSNSFLLT